MGDFDPDAYLADSSGPAAAPEENSFDPDKYLADFNPDAYLANEPAPEGPIARGVRNVAHGVLPAVTGLIGGFAGGALGAMAGSVVPGPGTVIGGFAGAAAGGVAAGYAGEKFQHAVQDFTGLNDDAQMAANLKADPTVGPLEQMIPAAATMRFDRMATLAQRAISAGAMGGIEAAQEAANEGTIDPKKVLGFAALGGVLPSTNRLGAKLGAIGERMVPGRPNRTANPDANQSHADVDDVTPETAVGDSSLAEPPPGPDGITTGNPQSAPERSNDRYPKENAQAAPENDMLTQGHMDPATAAALDANQPAAPSPAPEAAAPPQPEAPSPAPPPQPAGPNAAKPTLGLKPRAPAPPEPVVETGFPKPGEPVAVGENEATPMPQRAVPPKLDEVMKRLKGKTNPEPTEGQKEAGNYEKARERLFGHEVAYENMKGSERAGTDAEGKPWSSTLPADYGYFRKTVGADKDHVDVYNLRNGDKNFIVDQRDPDTGKFDEHKVMANAKDLDDARDTYLKAFSDEKGLARLHDITEVSPDELTQWLKGASKKKPYGAPVPKEKPLPKIVSKALEMAKAEGRDDIVAGLQKMNPSKQGMVAAQYVNAKTNKTGASNIQTARIRPAAPSFKVGDTEITGRTLSDVEFKKGSLAKVKAAFDKYPPIEDETREATHRRLEDAMAAVGGATRYKPRVPPAEWMWAKRADRYMKGKMSEKERGKFLQDENKLRGAPEDVENYRGGNRIEADIARSKRSGDEAVANAEAKQHLPGVNDTEDALINAIDAKRGRVFEHAAEDAEGMVEPTPVKSKADLKELPHKTIDSGDTDLAKIDTNKISAAAMRKAEAAKLAGKKAAVPEPAPKRYITLKDGTKILAENEAKASEARTSSIDISDPAHLKELIEMSNKAAKKHSASEENLAKEDLAKMPSGKPAYNETARLFDRFASNEDASLDIGKIGADLKRLKDNLTATTPVKSYIARPVHPTLEPHGDYTRGLSDELHTLENMNTRHEQNIKRDFIRKLPREANKDALQRIFKAREADSAHVDLPGKQAGKTNIESMSPSDKKVWDEHIKPMIDEANDFREQIKQIDPELAGPDVEHYIARITKGNTREFDLLRKSDDPVVRRNALAVHASMTNERPFVAIENQLTGERHVIQNRPEGGFTWWNNNKAIRVKDPNYEFEANKPYAIKNNKTGQSVPYIMRHATTDEIMKSGARFDLGKDKNGKKITMPATYYQNAALSAALAHAKLGAMARNRIELARLSSTPEFQALSTSRPTKEQIAQGWKESTMPNFKGISMAPELREVFDDYAGRAGDSFDNLRRLNQAVTKMLFWMPIAHIMNVGAHWFVGRGWDNLNVKRGLRTSMQAMQSVIKQDHIQKEMMENGAGLIYPSVDTRNFIEQIAKGVGEKMSEDPKSGWRAIAQQAGVPFKALQDAVYNKFSSKTMWAANDMFLTQRYLELKEKGLSPKEAVSRAERDIPNYRVPTRLGGGGTNARALSLLAQDNTLFAFSRYHVGMMNAYSDMIRGAFSSKSTVGDRVEALGKMLALGALAAAYPIADKVAKAVTGNEDATQNRRGPLAIPYHLNRAMQGKEDLASAGRATLTMQPLISTLMETYFNKDFRGKPIVEPGDVRQAFKGNAEAAGHVAKQAIGHAARGLISPLNTAVTAYKKKVNGEQQGIGSAVRDQALDIRNPSDKAAKYERMVPIKTFRDANARRKQGDW